MNDFKALPIARDIARIPSTRAPFRKMTRPPKAWILASSSDLSGCKRNYDEELVCLFGL